MKRAQHIKSRVWRCIFVSSLLLAPLSSKAELYISIVQGLGGAAEYDEQFSEQFSTLNAAAKTLTSDDKIKSFTGQAATREALLAHFDTMQTLMSADDRVAIYLIGHGSFDGFDYKFNIPGPDITGDDLKQLLASLPGRNHFLLNTSSTSGAMLETLIGDANSNETGGNILIAATRNGNERNATHFGRFFAEALTSEAADINKNNNISAQEAYDYASRQVESWFEDEGKLATEHPQLRGDGAAAFSLSRLNDLQLELANAAPEINELLQERLALDAEIEELQLRRRDFSNSEYITKLQALILQSAELSERIETLQQDNAGAQE